MHIAAQEAYAEGIDAKYGDDGFMFNLHAPKNLITGEGKPKRGRGMQDRPNKRGG